MPYARTYVIYIPSHFTAFLIAPYSKFFSRLIEREELKISSMATAHAEAPVLFFLALLLSSTHTPHHTSLVYAIRQEKQNSETSSVFSLPLHPHDSITNQQNQNYTARIISRLEGDAARVKYINSRLRNAIFKSDPNFQLEDIQSPLTHSGGGYAARVGVGQPAKEFYLLADTGSDITWLQCLPCEKCYQQVDPIFDPSKSSSYRPLSCSSQQCNALRLRRCGGNGTCLYGAVYGDNSFTVGDFATETLSFRGSDPVKNVAIGCGRQNQGFKGYAGIFGLGISENGFPSQIKASSFSYCLVNANSQASSTLEFNSAAPADSVTVSLLHNPKVDLYYYVELTGIKVGQDQIPIPPSVYQIGSNGTGGVIVDSGTTVTYLNSQVYSSVTDAFKKNAQNLQASQGSSFAGFDACYDVPTSSASSVNAPPMSFQFSGGKTLSLPRENYFIPVAISTNGQLTKLCLAFRRGDQTVSIIGNIQQQGMRVTYELGKNTIGFSPNKC